MSSALPPLKVEAAFSHTVLDVMNAVSVTWTDISSFVLFAQGVDFTRGRTTEGASTSPGTATFTTKTKHDGTTAGLSLRTPVRISWKDGSTWKVLWTGSVSEIRTGWHGGVRGVQEIACTDNVAVAERRLLEAWPTENALAIGNVAWHLPLDDRDLESPPREVAAAAAPPLLRPRAVGIAPEQSAVSLGSGYGPGREGSVATFTGSDADGGWCLEAYDALGRIGAGSLDTTMSVYLYIDDATSRTMVAFSGSYDHYSRNLRVDVGVHETGEAYAGWTLPGGGSEFVFGTTVLAPGAWHHIALVVDEVGTAVYECRLYVNGVKEDDLTTFNGPFNVARYGLRIGAGFSTVAPFNGQIAHVGLFTKALTAGEVASLAGVVTGYAGESTLARFNRVQRLVNYSSSTASGGVGVMGAQPIAGKTAASALGEVSTVEHAQWRCSRDGTLKLASRADRYNRSNPASRHVVGVPRLAADVVIPARAVSPTTAIAISDKDVANVVTGNRPGGITYTARNATSIAAYGQKSKSTTYLANSDGEVTTYVDADLLASSNPSPFIESFTLDVAAVQSTVTLGNMLGLDVDALIEVTDLPSSTTTTTNWYFVEGVADRVSPTGWQRTLNVTFVADPQFMADVKAAEVWKLDDTGYGLGAGGASAPAKPYGSRLGL